MSDEKYEAGTKIRREVLGDAHVDRSKANRTAFDADFQEYITEMVRGSVWTRGTLERQTRHMITIAILAALGREELELHLRATQNTGLTPEQIKEVFMHVAAYAGIPAANHAFATAKKVYKELGIDLGEVED